MSEIKILDKHFKISLSADIIQERIKGMAQQINTELAGKDVVFVVILNGAFVFASDLYKRINLESKISFLKLASYEGTSSTGRIKQLIGLNEVLKDKTVVVIEDIVDTGHTLDTILKQLGGFEPAEIRIASLLFKPESFLYNYKIDYLGFSIPNDFIVGYGLDYDGYGRNLDSIYTIYNP
ncbi:MAG TPA: hypoxanthine phosphoribosyltransferase [Bacteroidales bacterium]|jgi:hypoxanthine phosphoribosyltransferase|nr:hypoxanthine phosphoribosyltransferase [Bacteroidales bacterium]